MLVDADEHGGVGAAVVLVLADGAGELDWQVLLDLGYGTLPLHLIIHT